MVAKIRATVGKIRTQIKSMEVGVEFEGEGDEGEESEGRSNLELKNPENLEELAVMTEIEAYFNVTDNESDDRAFLMYMGNEVGGAVHRFFGSEMLRCRAVKMLLTLHAWLHASLAPSQSFTTSLMKLRDLAVKVNVRSETGLCFQEAAGIYLFGISISPNLRPNWIIDSTQHFHFHFA